MESLRVNATAQRAVHPAALLFPSMSEGAFRDFAADIKQNGLRDPIAVLPDGTLLDGRHRLRACLELGVEPRFETVNPESPVAFVISANLHRRQLTATQRATLAVELETSLAAEAKERMRAGGSKGGSNKGGVKVTPPLRDEGSRAREQAAKLVGSNNQYVQRAKRIKRDAPEVFEDMKAGKISLVNAQAKVASPGKRAQLQANAALRRAGEWVGRIDGVAGYCEKVNVGVVRGDTRMLRQWKEACKEAIKALRGLLKQLEK